MRPKKKVSLQDIASEVGVSVVTVSNALAGRRGVSDFMRERILDMAQQLGYIIPDSQKPQNEPYSIGILQSVGSSIDTAFIEWMRGKLSQAIHESGCTDYIINSDRDISELELDGIILLGQPYGESLPDILAFCSVPVVGCGFFDDSVDINYVCEDSFHNIALAVRALYKLGHRRISIAAPDGDAADPMTLCDKILGFLFECDKLGIEVCDLDEKEYFSSIDDMISRCSWRRFLEYSSCDIPRAIVCTESSAAQNIIEFLNSRSLKVPEDVSVTGYRSDFDREISPDISSVEFDTYVIARRSVDILIGKINGSISGGGLRMIGAQMVRGNTIEKSGA